MKKLQVIALLCLFLPLLASAGSSTYKIVGRAVDSTSKKGVPFATVTIQDSHSKILKQGASDGNGNFEFDLKSPIKGSVVVSAIGYSPAKATFSIIPNTKKISIGDILIAESSTQIGQVVIQAQRQLIKIEPDKISYNTAADPESQTINVLEMMRKVPLLTVDGDDNIKLKGAGNFKILINGKESPLMNNNAKDVLKGMPASSIKDIEVITNPSSKYSAEGIGGIINIITHKNTLSGFSGNTSIRSDNFGGYGGNLYTTAKLGKFAFSVNYGYDKWVSPGFSNYEKLEMPLNTKYTTSETHGYSKYHGNNNFASGELSYEIDSLNLISGSFFGYLGTYNSNNTATTSMYLKSSSNLVTKYELDGITRGGWGNISGNLDYQRSFKKPDKLFTTSYKLDYSPSSSQYDNEYKEILNYPPSRAKSKNTAGTYENTFQLDFINPLTPKHTYEVGLKYILRSNPSNIDYFNYNYSNSTWEANTLRNNDLNYTQHIIAAYVGYLLKLNRTSFKAGARIEGAYTDASYIQNGKDMAFDSNLTDVVPYLNISYNLSDASSVKFSYTQRLQRPGIWFLNPYINDENPRSISYGNPQLNTEKVNSFDLGYNYFGAKFSVDLSLYSRLNNNAIQSVITTQPSGFVQTYDNTGRNNTYGISLYSAYNPLPTFSISIYGNNDYNEYTGTSPEGVYLTKKGWTNSIGGNIRWNFLKSFTLTGFAGYNSSNLSLYGKSSSSYYDGFNLRKDFMDKKFALSVSVENPFRKYLKFENYTVGPNFSSYKMNNEVIRSIRFSITYKFGKMGQTVKKAARSINNDDVKGGGNKGASGGGK